MLRVVWETPAPLGGRLLPLQALCVETSDPRARLATLSPAWSWIPPCHVWSTFARHWERLVVGVFASKVCTANGVLHLSSGFALFGFPRSCTRLLWIVVLPLRPLGFSHAEALFESAYDTHSRSCPRCVWLCAPRGQWAPLDADMFEFIDRSSCLVEPVLVGRAILLLPVLAQTCTKHVQRRVRSLLANIPHREALRLVLCSPSCSSRAAERLKELVEAFSANASCILAGRACLLTHRCLRPKVDA